MAFRAALEDDMAGDERRVLLVSLAVTVAVAAKWQRQSRSRARYHYLQIQTRLRHAVDLQTSKRKCQISKTHQAQQMLHVTSATSLGFFLSAGRATQQ